MKSMMAAALAAVTLAAASAAASDPRISGPYQQDNLAVFLIHGPSAASQRPLMTLDEALSSGQAAVYETGDVNNLEIENLSDDRLLFVQSGVIVKGGKQDRVLSVDLVLPPGSGRTSTAAFCVEHGRWSQRGEESAQSFASADKAIAGKGLKLAAKSEKSQDGVWGAVAAAQATLTEVVGGNVAAPESPSSFQLTLENERVVQAIAAQIVALKELPDEQPDATGFIYAINGQIAGGDIYGSPELFRKLWAGLLEASAIEAVAAKGDMTAAVIATGDDVRRFLASTDEMAGQKELLPAGVTLVVREDDKVAAFETSSSEIEGSIHRSYIVK